MVAESRELFHHQAFLLQLCDGLGFVINWEKSTLQYLSMMIDTSLERVFPSQARLVRFWEVASSFLLLPSPPVRMWHPLLGHMASL